MTALNAQDSELLGTSVLLAQDLLIDILSHITLLESHADPQLLTWNRMAIKITSDISTFVELTTLTSKLMSKKGYAALPEIKESHIHLLFILKGVSQATQKQDIIVLGELLKYELKDNLTQWKIDLIPQLKRLLNL